MSVAWAPSTLETYGAGLLLFHAICDSKGVPEDARAPASKDLLSVFLAELAGSYSVSALSNYLAGVQAWHRLHRLPWLVDPAEQQLLVRGAGALVRRHDAVATPSSRITKGKRLPLTVALLSRVREQLDLSSSLDAAVYACAAVMLHGVGRPSELTTTSLTSFDPTVHVSVANLTRDVTDREGNVVTALRIPRTKSCVDGEVLTWGRQLDDTDPDDALDNHFRVNAPQPGEHLFAHHARGRSRVPERRPLTSDAFMKRFREALCSAGVTEKYSAHCFRIGGTLEYLLRGLPFEVVANKGRWASDAFKLYLRDHATILAPYMQANPAAWQRTLAQLNIPPVR